jgi:hypothetical protein
MNTSIIITTFISILTSGLVSYDPRFGYAGMIAISTFLATQTIDKAEWDTIKADKPEVAEQELDVFSDLVWEGVLTRAEYLEHFSKNHIFLFQSFDTHVRSIVLKSLMTDVDFLTKEGLQWLSDNMFTDTIEMKVGKKEFTEERNTSLFALIKQGAFLSDGQLYKQINSIIEG